MGNHQEKLSRENLILTGESAKLTTEQASLIVDQLEHLKTQWLNRKQFHSLVKVVGYKFPNVPALDPEISDLTFDICDTNNDGHISGVELMKALGVFSTGTLEEKATLAFTSYDHNNDGFIDKKELCEHAKLVVGIAKKVVGHNARKNKGNIFALSLEPVLAQCAPQVIEKLVDEALKADEDHDGKLSKLEWLAALRKNSAIKTMSDPYSSAHIFDDIIDRMDKKHLREGATHSPSAPRTSEELVQLRTSQDSLRTSDSTSNHNSK